MSKGATTKYLKRNGLLGNILRFPFQLIPDYSRLLAYLFGPEERRKLGFLKSYWNSKYEAYHSVSR